MNNLRIESVKRSCAFTLKIESPIKTLEKLCALLASRSIRITMLQLQEMSVIEATLIIHCQVEKDRIPYFVSFLEKMEGVVELEWMESRGRNKQYGK